MTPIQALIEKYNATEVLGRLLVRINGRNEWLATTDGASFILTETGLKLEEGLLQVDGAAPSAPAEEPKRKPRAKKQDDVQGDLFEGLDAE